MKQSITFLLALFSVLMVTPFITLAQDDPDDGYVIRIGHSYTFTSSTKVTECDINGNVADVTKQIAAPTNSSFYVFDQVDATSVIIYFWDWADKSNLSKTFNYTYSGDTKGERKYFRVSIANLKNKAIPRYIRWKTTLTAGTAIIPIKVRFNNFDFNKDFTLGPTIGVRWRIAKHTDNFLNAMLGFGVTSVTLDSASTDGALKANTDRFAVTPSFGLLLEFDNVQVGLFTGMDYLSKKENIDWRYQGKSWFSVGLGYTILTKTSTTSNIEPKNKPRFNK
ncbi:hypothetical protein HUW51_00995 (plasmid) [Adhaeribacter swui]|uniref:Outer membrane beta-barrel protein n=1 Tax=Adhaeribacter swui TaxID=2086471 RepID=A0A7G7G2I1_9BACT|nr:hypothetical protein [Adhaeribacter swui]QNF31365.1 hypothetical protein HUW51_00995 [Adhaeribacter swui]